MKIAKYLLALTLVLTPLPVLANTVAIPNTFVNGQFIDANLFNQNFQAIATFANGNVDATNIGAAGIYGSQIIPTNVTQAIFGGTLVYTFPAGLNINGAVLKANLGLTVVGTTNLAATTFSVPPTMSGANITARTIPNLSLVTTPITALTAGSNITLTGTAPNITISASGAVAGVTSVTASGNVLSSGGATPNITLVASPTITGNLIVAGTGQFNGPVTVQSVLNSGAAAHIIPLYTAGGADAGARAHAVSGTATATANSVIVTFLGNAVFTSISSYVCLVHDRTSQSVLGNYSTNSGSAFNFSATNGDTYDYVCTGF